jgi:hypothetical protein
MDPWRLEVLKVLLDIRDLLAQVPAEVYAPTTVGGGPLVMGSQAKIDPHTYISPPPFPPAAPARTEHPV